MLDGDNICNMNREGVVALKHADAGEIYAIGCEAVVREIGKYCFFDGRNLDEYLSWKAKGIPDGAVLIAGFSSWGKLLGCETLSARGARSEEALLSVITERLPANAFYILTARKTRGACRLGEEFDFAKTADETCRKIGKSLKDHAVVIDGRWRYIISEFRKATEK